MQISERYKWEAETAAGEIISSGGDLRGCVRFSLIPAAAMLPRHDFTGIPLRKRFCRGFIKTRFGEKITLPGLFFWESGSAVVKTEADLAGELSPGDVIGKGVAGDGWYQVKAVAADRVVLTRPYDGITKIKGFVGRKMIGLDTSKRAYWHCLETPHVRYWVNYETGGVLVTPKDFELYI